MRPEQRQSFIESKRGQLAQTLSAIEYFKARSPDKLGKTICWFDIEEEFHQIPADPQFVDTLHAGAAAIYRELVGVRRRRDARRIVDLIMSKHGYI